MKIVYDPMFGEPEPRKYFAIKCFTCGYNLSGKAGLGRNHRGHEVHYIDSNGNIDEG